MSGVFYRKSIRAFLASPVDFQNSNLILKYYSQQLHLLSINCPQSQAINFVGKIWSAREKCIWLNPPPPEKCKKKLCKWFLKGSTLNSVIASLLQSDYQTVIKQQQIQLLLFRHQLNSRNSLSSNTCELLMLMFNKCRLHYLNIIFNAKLYLSI